MKEKGESRRDSREGNQAVIAKAGMRLASRILKED
jgi:hypothetical protein